MLFFRIPTLGCGRLCPYFLKWGNQVNMKAFIIEPEPTVQNDFLKKKILSKVNTKMNKRKKMQISCQHFKKL